MRNFPARIVTSSGGRRRTTVCAGGGACPQRRRPAWRLFAVSQNYVTYQLDSAAYYVDRLYRLAASAGSGDIRRIALLADIDVWLGRGSWGLPKNFSAG